MIAEVLVKPLLFVAKKGTENSDVFRVIRNALIGATVSFTTTKVLEKTYNAVEKKRSADTDEQN